MRKEFELSAKLNTADFDKSVEQIVRKLKDVTQPISAMQQSTAQRAQQNGLGGLSPQTMDAFQKATASARKELDQMITEQVKQQEKLGKFIAQRTESIKKMIDEQKKLVSGSKEELEIREKIIRAEQNQQSLKEAYRQRDAQLNQSLDAKEAMREQQAQEIKNRNPEGWNRAGRFAKQGMYRQAGRDAFNAMGGLQGVGNMVGGIGAAVSQGANLYRDFSYGDLRAQSSMGNAVQGTVGRDINNIYGRRSSFENNFLDDKRKAAQQAIEQMQTNMAMDKLGLAGNTASIVGGAAGGFGGWRKGAAIGAAAGSIVPGIGTAAGGTIGGIAGAAPGLALAGKGLMGLLGDERQRSLALSPFSKTANNRYESLIAEQMAKDYETSYEDRKKLNPFKTAAVGEYEQNWQRNLGAQRQMGLDNKGFYGKDGFLDKNISAGFTPEMGLEMSSSIMGAGGSTRMSRGEGSAFGNQLARGHDLTNAGNVLGTLSGGLGSFESTKLATIKILAEGTKIGLDDSKFAEENRKFTQITADIIAKAGAIGADDQQRLSAGFGAFVADKTMGGMDAAKSAYEKYQQISQETSGPRGVMRAAGFLSDPILSKLPTMTQQALMKIPDNQLSEDHPVVLQAAEKSGKSPKEIIASISGVTGKSVSRHKEFDDAISRITKYAKDSGKNHLTEEDMKYIQKDVNTASVFATSEHGITNKQELNSFIRAQANRELDPLKQAEYESKVEGKLTGDTGRMEDSNVKAMASESRAVLDNFNEMAPAMKKVAEMTATWTKAMWESAAAMQAALEAARNGDSAGLRKATVEYMKNHTGTRSSTQPQGGRSSTGSF